MKNNQEKKLNPQQKEAIQHKKGPLLIIAGAGTGKTTVVTERIKYLISKNLCLPSEILALTFTEKAAAEMEERVDEIMPYGFTQMWISTFHAFCDRILRDEALHIGLDYHFTLMTEAETILFLKKHLFFLPLNYFRPSGNPNKFLSGLLQHFSRLKDEDISPNQYLDWAKFSMTNDPRPRRGKAEGGQFSKDENEKNQELAQAYQKYEELKIKESVMDFSDLISHTLKLFRTRPNVLKQYQQKFKYILVDEFQDTNIAQNELVNLLAGKQANLTCVCDDDQSIYKWRGAAVSNVLQFRKNYPKAKIITLTQNYRSTQEILNRAYDLIIHNNPDRLEVQEKINKKLVAVNKQKGEKIQFFSCSRVEDEAEVVAAEIKKLTKAQYQYHEIAILVRANDHNEPFVKALMRAGIPFQFLGPGKLLRQEEVKDLIAYLRVLTNFEDNVAFFRILSMPVFGITGRETAALRNWARRNNRSLFEAAENNKQLYIDEKARENLEKLVKMIHRHLEILPQKTAGQILYYFLEDSGLLAEFASFKTEKEEQKVNNIKKFFDKLKSYEAEHEDASVLTINDWLAMKMELGESPLAADTDWTQENKVNILTVHSAKGLEFEVVFLVNLVEERFPTRNRREQIPIPDTLIKETLPTGDPHLQEERRLFYVGLTRGKILLYLTAAKFYGEGKRIKKISPFVPETLGKQFSAKGRPASGWNNQLSIFDFKPIEVKEEISGKKRLFLSYVSYSQIDTFSRCPLQYRYKYILGIPTAGHHSASFGTSIHATLRDFYQNLKQGQKQTLNDLMIILEKDWLNLGYEDKNQEKQAFARAKTLLTDFWGKFYQAQNVPKFLEQNFKFPLRMGLVLGGKIDRIDESINGEMEIIDYKTGDKVPTQKDVDKDLQLTLYAMAASQKHFLGKDPEQIKLSLLFLKQSQKVSTRRTKEDLNKLLKDLLKTVEKMEKSDFLPTPNQFICNFCEYKLLCPVWQ